MNGAPVTTTTTTTTSPIIDAGDALLSAIRAAVRTATVDRDAIRAALDNFSAATGTTGDDLKPIEVAAREVARRHKQGYDFRDQTTATRMAAQYMWKVADAIDDLAAPFERDDDLTAAEQELAQRESAAQQAMRQLEQAVQDGDVDAVMKLRGEVEVKHPRRIAEARTAVLELRIEQASARQSATAGRAERIRTLRQDAEQRQVELTQQLAQAVEDITLADLEAGELGQAASRAATEVRQMQAELGNLKTSHEQEMQARLRRIAGLPELEQQQEPESTQIRIIGAASRSDAHDFNPTTVGSY